MCTLGKAQPKGCCPSLQCSSPRGCAENSRKMCPAFTQTGDKRRARGWKLSCERMERNSKGHPCYWVWESHGRKGALIDPALQGKHSVSARTNSSIKVVYLSLSECAEWVSLGTEKTGPAPRGLELIFWYIDIFNERVLISLLLCLVRVQQVCWYE